MAYYTQPIYCDVWEFITYARGTHHTLEGVLYTCQGQVLYQQGGISSGWHGSYQHCDHDPVMMLKFNYKRECWWRHKNVVMFRVSPTQYHGFDQERRSVAMRFLGRWKWDPENCDWVSWQGMATVA